MQTDGICFKQTHARFQTAIFIVLPQCPGAGVTQATQLHHCIPLFFLNKRDSTIVPPAS